jgi:hypothetical protein
MVRKMGRYLSLFPRAVAVAALVRVDRWDVGGGVGRRAARIHVLLDRLLRREGVAKL